MSTAMRYRAQELLRRTRPCDVLRSSPRRFVQIAATPSSTNPTVASAAADSTAPGIYSRDMRKLVSPLANKLDAQFEVLGSPFSLLSASISASQNLYTRKGSLVGFHGDAESTVSSLSILEPFRRAAFGIPFLYQKVTSTAPYTALISSKSPLTTFSVIHLDGRLDWMIAQRNALLAWTGHTLSIKPQVNTSMSIAHWGSSRVTGRGLLCLSGKGQAYQLALKSGEEYIVHPSNVIAYSIMQHAPQPYRFKSSNLRLQIPNAFSYLPDTRFFQVVRQSNVWRVVANTLFTIRTWARRSIWGDRMFLRFQGPANILLQSRGAKLTDAFTARDVNEAADTPAGVLQAGKSVTPAVTDTSPSTPPAPTKLSYATVESDGKVTISKS